MKVHEKKRDKKMWAHEGPLERKKRKEDSLYHKKIQKEGVVPRSTIPPKKKFHTYAHVDQIV